MLRGIAATACIQRSEGYHIGSGQSIGMYGIYQHRGIEGSRCRIAKVPCPLCEGAAPVQGGHIGELRALTLAGVLCVESGNRGRRNGEGMLYGVLTAQGGKHMQSNNKGAGLRIGMFEGRYVC